VPSSTFHLAVVSDVDTAAQRFEAHDIDLGRRLIDDFEARIILIEDFPYLGSELFEHYRHMMLQHFPYLVAYRIIDDIPQILAVIDARRDPETIRTLVGHRATSA
jgi:hypothetical protein